METRRWWCSLSYIVGEVGKRCNVCSKFPSCFVLDLVTACTEWLMRCHRSSCLCENGSNVCISYALLTVCSVQLSMSELLRVIGSRQGCSRLVILVLERSVFSEQSPCIHYCIGGRRVDMHGVAKKSRKPRFGNVAACVSLYWLNQLYHRIQIDLHHFSVGFTCTYLKSGGLGFVTTFTRITPSPLACKTAFEKYQTCCISIAKLCVYTSAVVLQRTCQASCTEHRMSVLYLGRFRVRMSLSVREVLAEVDNQVCRSRMILRDFQSIIHGMYSVCSTDI